MNFRILEEKIIESKEIGKIIIKAIEDENSRYLQIEKDKEIITMDLNNPQTFVVLQKLGELIDEYTK